MPIQTFFDHLDHGGTVEQFLEWYDGVTREALEAAANMGTPDRALLINLAVAQSGCGRAMRGAKYIQKYLESIPPTQAPDEPLLNTMKIMLESIPPDMRSAEYARMQATYDRLNKRLEDKAGNGQKRWGLKWISAEEYAENEKQRKSAEQEIAIKGYQLPELLRVKVVAGPDGSGVGPAVSLEPEADPDAGVSVPVVPKVC